MDMNKEPVAPCVSERRITILHQVEKKEKGNPLMDSCQKFLYNFILLLHYKCLLLIMPSKKERTSTDSTHQLSLHFFYISISKPTSHVGSHGLKAKRKTEKIYKNFYTRDGLVMQIKKKTVCSSNKENALEKSKSKDYISRDCLNKCHLIC